MLIPLLPLYLRDLGLSYQLLTTVLSAAGVGALLAQIPAGAAIARWGEARVGIVATTALGISIALVGITTTTLVLISLCLVSGVGTASWLLTRFSVMSTDVAGDHRGRVSSTFGGMVRAGRLIGAVGGGLVAGWWGFTPAFVIAGLVSLLGVVPLMDFGKARATDLPEQFPSTTSVVDVARDNRRALSAAGLVQFVIIAVREGRLVVIPLLGAAMGLDVASVGLLVAVGAGSDLLLFPLAGWLMDHFTRLAASVPAITLLGLGVLIAAQADTAQVLTAGAALAGIGNGMGAGILVTIQGDLAPADEAGRFLGLLGVVRNLGRIGGPVAVGIAADRLGLATSASLLAFGALVAVGLLFGVLGDTSDGTTRLG